MEGISEKQPHHFTQTLFPLFFPPGKGHAISTGPFSLLRQRMMTNLCGSWILRNISVKCKSSHIPGTKKKPYQLRHEGILPWGMGRYIWVSGALSHGPFQSIQQTYHHGKPGKHPWKLLHFLLWEKGCTIQKWHLGRYFGNSSRILIGSAMETKTKEIY